MAVRIGIDKSGVAVYSGDRHIASIGKAGWPKPSVGDESIWMGGNTWGDSAMRDRIENPQDQIRYYKSWTFVCVNYNSKTVAGQTLRLYVRKRKGRSIQKAMQRRGLTVPVPKTRYAFLRSNKGLDPWLSAGDDVEELIEHPWLTMMKKPNAVLKQADLWMYTEMFMGLTGNCYWWKRPGPLDEPGQLWIMETQYVTPVPGKSMDQYLLGYLYQVGVRRVPFAVEDVCHHKYPNPFSMIKGYSPLQGICDSVKTNESMNRYEKALFRNMARPDGVIEMDESLGDPEYKRLKREWDKAMKGEDKQGQVVIMEGGGKYKQISMTPRELNNLQGRKITKEEIANGYGVPLPLVTADTNLANLRAANEQYMRDTIAPKLMMYEQNINADVIPDYEGGEDLFAAFDDCVPEDKIMKLKERETNLRCAYTTVNQERAKDGEEPQDGYGDVPLVSAGTTELGSEAAPAAAAAPAKPGEGEKEMREFARAIAAQILGRGKS